MVFRRRSLLYKLLLLVPAVWFCALLMFAANGGGRTNYSADKDDAKNAPIVDTKSGGSGGIKVEKIEGFGPPLDNKVPESLGGDGGEDDGDKEKKSINGDSNNAVIPAPNKFVFDPDSPIYKKGDANQAGESGRAVKIDKKVIYTMLASLDIFSGLSKSLN